MKISSPTLKNFIINKDNGSLKNTAYILPVLSGAVLILAFPPFEQGYLAWLALAPLLWFCLNATPRQAFFGGFLFAFILHLYLNSYLTGVLFAYLSLPLTLVTTGLLIAATSLFYAIFAMLIAYIKRFIQGLALVFAVPALWLLMEYARSLGLLGYNVGYIGYTQWSYPLLLNLTALYGYWGLSFCMVTFQTTLLATWERIVRGKQMVFALIIFIALVACGLVIPETTRLEKAGDVKVQVALIQGNSSPDEILSAAGKLKIYERYLAMTREAVKNNPAVELVVWPETVVDLVIRNEPQHKIEMETLARQLDVSILYGARVRTEQDLFNSIVLLTPYDQQFQVYNKHRLVPFVEYFPLERQLNRLLDLQFRLGSYTPGEEVKIFDFNQIPLAGVGCFESYFGDHTRQFAHAGGRHLFVLTNDVWFDGTIGLEQHVQVAAIRAAEMGTGVTQVANSGITASYDYRGRELFRSGKSKSGIYYLPLDLTARTTVYRQAGEYFPAFWLLYMTVLIISIFFSTFRRKNRNAKTP